MTEDEAYGLFVIVLAFVGLATALALLTILDWIKAFRRSRRRAKPFLDVLGMRNNAPGDFTVCIYSPDRRERGAIGYRGVVDND